MFVRFRQTAYRLQVSLVEGRRIDGKVRHEHIASLGSIASPMAIADRVAFWSAFHQRLAKLSNRIDADAHGKIIGSVHARIPMVTIDEQRALQLENAEADEKFWAGHKQYQAGLAEDLKGLGAEYQRQGSDAEMSAAEAAKKASVAKERQARLAKGEDVAGGLKPLTREDAIRIMRGEGLTDSDIRHCEHVHTLGTIGAYEEYEQECKKAHDRANRAEKSIARKILRKHGRV